MKTTITIEQFDNGITIIADNGNGNQSKRVCLEHSKLEEIGKEIWADVEYSMNMNMINKVRLDIEFTPIKEEQL